MASKNEEFIQRLTEECYLYFSAGDRYAFEACKHAEVIRQYLESKQHQSVQSIEIQADRLTYLLLKVCD
jgi:hypothetical protein